MAGLDYLLNDVAEGIAEHELGELKILLFGTLEAIFPGDPTPIFYINTPRQLFDILKGSGIISENDVTTLRDVQNLAADKSHILEKIRIYESDPDGYVDRRSRHNPIEALLAGTLDGTNRPMQAFGRTREMVSHQVARDVVYEPPEEPIHMRTNRPTQAVVRTREMVSHQVATDFVYEPPDEPIHMRRYQLELAQDGIAGVNCIICAPTGSGKTYTAGHIIYKRWQAAREDGSKFKALFLVCIRNLVSQQTKGLKNVFGRDHDVIEGFEETDDIKTLFEDHGDDHQVDIGVLTSQLLVNRLREKGNNKSYLEDFNLLIFDECHHANLDHPYNRVMRFYMEELRDGHTNLPQIIGLTASLGVGDTNNPVDHYIHMCANLQCHTLCFIKENVEEFERLVPPPNPNQIKAVAGRNRTRDPFLYTIIHMMKHLQGFLEKQPEEEPGTQTYETELVRQRKDGEEDGQSDKIALAETLLNYNRALFAVDDLRYEDALPRLEEFFAIRPPRPSELRRRIYRSFDDIQPDLEAMSKREPLGANRKLVELKDLLVKLFRNNTDSRGIILTKTRYNVVRLKAFIQEQEELLDTVRCERFVGKGIRQDKKSEFGAALWNPNDAAMTDAEQENILKKFRKGFDGREGLNLLVSTNILEEGLDIPQCNIVIRYNYVSNEIGAVQARGRARAKDSQCYLIINAGSIDVKREYKNIQKEYYMQEALKDFDDMDQLILRARIDEKQIKIQNTEDEKGRRKEQAKGPADDITINCTKCQTLLCNASDMKFRDPHFIVCCKDFTDKFREQRMTRPKPFNYDTQIATTWCTGRGCSARLGLKLEYKQGRRNYGYVLSKAAATYKKGDEPFRTIKQWSKVPFVILPDEEY